MIEERTVVASTHGRFLVRKPEGGGRAPLLVGFHGYAETAETQLERLRQLPGTERWVLASVQGLHTFYRGRSQDVVASWMTRQHRDLAIADNIAYVSGVVDSVARECETTQGPVLAGFSQGVATAFRAAVWSARPTSGVIAVGGDIPPELDDVGLAKVRAALLVRGSRDEWYTSEKMAGDVIRLTRAGVEVRASTVDGGHEWTEGVAHEASSFLARLTTR